MQNKKHGGARQGAGKPALYGKPMIRKNVMLDPETIEILKALGGGNLSEGIRKAAEQSMHPTRESLAQKVSSKSKRSVKPARG